MNPYSIEGWVSRIQDKECREFFRNSENYEQLKDKVCSTFPDAFLKCRFNNNDIKFQKESSWFGKLRRGQIKFCNPHTLNGEVFFFDSGRVIDNHDYKIGTIIENYGEDSIIWDKGVIENFNSAKNRLSWINETNTVNNDSYNRTPGSIVTFNDIGAKVVRNPEAFPNSNRKALTEIGTIIENPDDDSIRVEWDVNAKYKYPKLSNHLLYADIQADTQVKENNMKTGVVTRFEEGVKVVRNPVTWKYNNQDFHNGKPSVGVMTTEYDGRILVKWESGQSYSYLPEHLLYYNGDSTDTVPIRRKKSETLKGHNVCVPNVLSTVKSGKVPTGNILKPNIKKAIIIKSNLQFREVVI